ncbi:MAG: transglycosylase SLT domain-containing protein [Azospirillaceae bacterium]|nr:transglycosylase SLT domain-containing protein [Azospirillaceae bacterium]
MSIAQTLQTLTQASAARVASVSPTVKSAIQDAANTTGVNFSYLMAKAAQESGFDTSAKSSSSSATGLYQFIDSTWLNMLQEHGAQYGLGDVADAIGRRSDGAPYIADPTVRKEVMDLRKNAKVSALMAAEYTKENQSVLEQKVGGAIGSTELYLAHFLGSSGASKFLTAMRQNPNQSASSLLPDAAAANRTVFYNDTGGSQTLQQVYDHFASRFNGTASESRFASGSGPGAYGSGGGSGSESAYSRVVAAAKSPMSLYTVMVLAQLQVPDDPGALRKHNPLTANSQVVANAGAAG